ncbi:MAG: ATPase [Alphaproteobacteria bacterium]|nr:ATPase [Alphaproteobacteria bacterium]
MTGGSGAKRFYKAVSIVQEDGGHVVLLDGRAVKSPAKGTLLLPTVALAEAVAGEWDAQTDKIDANTMPMMSFAATTIDRVTPNRAHVIAEIAAFGRSDLLCYRAETPETLVERQVQAWGEMLSWAEEQLGVQLLVTEGLMPVEQPATAVARLKGHVEAHSDWELAPLHTVTTISGSLVIGLAVTRGHLDAGGAFEIGELDETFQSELWGLDREAEDRRRLRRAELEAAERFLTLARA